MCNFFLVIGQHCVKHIAFQFLGHLWNIVLNIDNILGYKPAKHLSHGFAKILAFLLQSGSWGEETGRLLAILQPRNIFLAPRAMLCFD